MKKILTGICLSMLVSLAMADSYVVGPAVDQNGKTTGKWCVYKVDGGGRITTVGVFKKKDKADKEADKLNTESGNGYKYEPGHCDKPGVLC